MPKLFISLQILSFIGFAESVTVPGRIKRVGTGGPEPPGIEDIKLEYSLKLRIKRNNWLLVDMSAKQPIIALYFESENELEFYNFEACNITSGYSFP